MYHNLGFVTGTLRFAPRQVSEGVVLLTLRVMGTRLNTKTGERERVAFFPTFTIFGREAHKALANLEEGQRVEMKYRLETRTKEIDGDRRFFEDKVVVEIIYGPKRGTAQPPQAENRSARGPQKPVVIEQPDEEEVNDEDTGEDTSDDGSEATMSQESAQGGQSDNSAPQRRSVFQKTMKH